MRQLRLALIPNERRSLKRTNSSTLTIVVSSLRLKLLHVTPKEEHRRCTSCNQLKKLLKSFDINFSGANGSVFRKHQCKNCRKTIATQRRKLSKQVSISAYIGKKCAICQNLLSKKGYRRAVIDHDHETGKLRGVLCNNCNTGMGKLGDSVEGLRRAIDYLSRGNSRV